MVQVIRTEQYICLIIIMEWRKLDGNKYIIQKRRQQQNQGYHHHQIKTRIKDRKGVTIQLYILQEMFKFKCSMYTIWCCLRGFPF